MTALAGALLVAATLAAAAPPAPLFDLRDARSTEAGHIARGVVPPDVRLVGRGPAGNVAAALREQAILLTLPVQRQAATTTATTAPTPSPTPSPSPTHRAPARDSTRSPLLATLALIAAGCLFLAVRRLRRRG